MKKLLLAAAATAAFSSSAFADNEFYLRADAGYNKFNNNKSDGETLKGKYSPSMDLGVGYNVMDNVRAELVYGYQFNPTKKWSATVDDVKSSSKMKAKIHTLMIKAYADVADLGVAQIFAGAGVGMAQKSIKMTGADGKKSWSIKEKKNNTFTYSLALGSAFDVADSVKIDVQYNFQDFGKTANKTVEKVSFRSHAIKAGVRFAL